FFCGPESASSDEVACDPIQVVVKKAVPTNENVLKSYEDIKVAENGVVEAKSKADAKVAEAKGQEESKRTMESALTPEYLRFLEIQAVQKCAETPDCTIVVTQGGDAPELTLPALGR